MKIGRDYHIRGTDPVLTSYTKYHEVNKEKNLDLEKARENEQIKKIMKEEETKVHSVYNSQGKRTDHKKDGRNFDSTV
ncbi:Uncharacterised protein [uncultured archaeon]|nr:Uncharacterised protein [uncultured archaeon]